MFLLSVVPSSRAKAAASRCVFVCGLCLAAGPKELQVCVTVCGCVGVDKDLRFSA